MRGNGPYQQPQRGGGDAPGVGQQFNDLGRQCNQCFGTCCAAIVEGLKRTPLCTRIVVILCLAIFLGMLATGTPVATFCSGPGLNVDTGEWWRLATAPVVHVNFIHWLTNAFAAWSMLGSWNCDGYEHTAGTAPVAVLFIVYALGAQTLSLIPAFIIHYAFHVDDVLGVITWNGCSAGISGALFAFMTAYYRDRGQVIPCCGFVIGPSVFPFIMLLLIALLWPQATFFLGHLMGIFLGFLIDHTSFPFLNRLMERFIECTRADSLDCHCKMGGGGLGGAVRGGGDGGWQQQQQAPQMWQQQPQPQSPPRFAGAGRPLGLGGAAAAVVSGASPQHAHGDGPWTCGKCTYRNTKSNYKDMCEMCGTARGAEEQPLLQAQGYRDPPQLSGLSSTGGGGAGSGLGTATEQRFPGQGRSLANDNV